MLQACWGKRLSIRFIRWVKHVRQNERLRILQKLFNFWVVLGLDLLVVEESLLLAFVRHKLEAVAVDGVFILVSGNVMDDNVLDDVRTDNIVRLADALVLDSR